MPRENAPRKFGSSGLIFIFVHWCFPVNFVKFLRMPFLQNTSGRLLLKKTCHAGWVFYELFHLSQGSGWVLIKYCALVSLTVKQCFSWSSRFVCSLVALSFKFWKFFHATASFICTELGRRFNDRNLTSNEASVIFDIS